MTGEARVKIDAALLSVFPEPFCAGNSLDSHSPCELCHLMNSLEPHWKLWSLKMSRWRSYIRTWRNNNRRRSINLRVDMKKEICVWMTKVKRVENKSNSLLLSCFLGKVYLIFYLNSMFFPFLNTLYPHHMELLVNQ